MGEALVLPGLSFRNVSKEYSSARGPLLAVRDLSLDVGGGEFVCITGPSGCGKTTVLRLAAGLIKPSTGVILFENRPVDLPNTKSAYVPQGYSLFPWLTVEQNVAFGLRLRRMPTVAMADRVQRLLTETDMTQFREFYPDALSGGMKQRVALARALAIQPSILLMDEPFGSLDGRARVSMQDQLLATWQVQPTSVVFVTHDVAEAIYLADRIVLMSSGPGTASLEVPVEIQRPRHSSIKRSRYFADLVDYLESQFSHSEGESGMPREGAV